MMTHFTYKDGQLCVEQVAIATLAKAVGTPFYVYSDAILEQQYRQFANALAEAGLDAQIFYALKANSNLSVLATLAALGAGADIVSEGELRRALAAGIPAEKIIFSGVGKSRHELALALKKGVYQINVESREELHRLSAIAASMGIQAPIAIRVNPDVDAKTHAKITTGKKENKFGIDIAYLTEIYSKAQALPGIQPVALAVHIGSQITDLAPFQQTFTKVATAIRTLHKMGIAISQVDLGGGLGIAYKDEKLPTIAAYAGEIAKAFAGLDVKICLEPGRLIVGEAGLLVSRVEYVKQGDYKRFIIVDAAMNDLIRPTLYGGYHQVMMGDEAKNTGPTYPADIVGPVCESGDYLAIARSVAMVEEDDLMAFTMAGAYGAVMASTYNSRCLILKSWSKGNIMP